MSTNCLANPCPIIVNSSCVFYQGPNLICLGVNTNDTIENALIKINAVICDVAGLNGTSGTSGISGTDGTGGTSGSSGSSGTSGTTGTSGTAGTSGLTGDFFRTTSTTLYTLQAPGNPGTITVGTGLAYSPAQSIIIAFDSLNHNEAVVDSYDSLTGVINFTTFALTGSGTYSAWDVNLDGATGGDGSSGTSGINGTSGSSGSSGINGTSGTTGTSGSSGVTGTSGTGGTSGIDGTSGINGTSGSSGITGASGVNYVFSHGSLSPGDGVTYYMGDIPDLPPTNTNNITRQIISQYTGSITEVAIMINIGGAFGTTENSTMTINNVTTGLSSTISTTIQHNADGNVNYVLASPLAVTVGDALQTRWITPTWVTNPTTVRQRFNVKII